MDSASHESDEDELGGEQQGIVRERLVVLWPDARARLGVPYGFYLYGSMSVPGYRITPSTDANIHL